MEDKGCGGDGVSSIGYIPPTEAEMNNYRQKRSEVLESEAL